MRPVECHGSEFTPLDYVMKGDERLNRFNVYCNNGTVYTNPVSRDRPSCRFDLQNKRIKIANFWRQWLDRQVGTITAGAEGKVDL